MKCLTVSIVRLNVQYELQTEVIYFHCFPPVL